MCIINNYLYSLFFYDLNYAYIRMNKKNNMMIL